MTRLTHSNQIFTLICFFNRCKFTKWFYVVNGQTFADKFTANSATFFLFANNSQANLFPFASAISLCAADIIRSVCTRLKFFLEFCKTLFSAKSWNTVLTNNPRFTSKFGFAKFTNKFERFNPTRMFICQIIAAFPSSFVRLYVRFQNLFISLPIFSLARTRAKFSATAFCLAVKHLPFIATFKTSFIFVNRYHLYIIQHLTRILQLAFMGIGSTAFVAIEQNRNAVGFELKESYFDQSQRNVAIAHENRTQADNGLFVERMAA